MAAGLPVVASNIEGYAGVLTHGVEGLLSLPEDEESLADALLDLLEHKTKRLKMAEQGRIRVQEFKWSRVSQRVLSYYERLLYERDLSGGPTKAKVAT
jgi:phosphatidylinositol alpha-mannosyltransferase